MGNHGELLVKRTKVLYGAVALMLFGALGVGVQVSESSHTVGVVAPALSDACKDYNFYNTHVEACSTAAVVTSVPTPPPVKGTAPDPANVVSAVTPLFSANR